MTAVNWILKPSVAAVLTDTRRFWLNGSPMGFTSKVAVVPHLNLILAVRGTNQLSIFSYIAAREWVQVGGIDAYAEKMPGELRSHHPTLIADLKAANPPPSADLHADAQSLADGSGELLVFGWSERHGRIIGLLFSSLANFEPQRLPDGIMFAPEIRITPTEAERRAISKERVPESLIVGTKVQRRDCAENIGIAIGGELVLTEIRRGGLSMRVVHRFQEDFDDFERQGAGHD
jgi:hypothetical protein